MEKNLYPPSIEGLIEEFSRLPGVGRRSAERMAFHVLSSGRDEAMGLAFAIRNVKKNLRACDLCFNVAEDELCHICADAGRDHEQICVVELPRDIIVLEKSGAYTGTYHVLQGRLNPAEGMGPEQLRVAELIKRLPVREVILATNPTTEGDATASYLAGELAGHQKSVTRLARGISSGTDLESSPPSSLAFAFEGRREIDGTV